MMALLLLSMVFSTFDRLRTRDAARIAGVSNLYIEVRCDSTPPLRVTLAAGETVTRTIMGNRNPNHTGVMMVRDGGYVLTAAGSWQDGTQIPATDANGTPNDHLPVASRVFLWPFHFFRPVPDANWMALVGKIDQPEQRHFLIGVGPTNLSATASGELVALANDYKHYSNNLYCVTLTVRRTK